ncbi:MAG TPA: hypothetical protein VH352_21645 [Pseudonocardiaceae bacterium]|jgi:hypothetical protein|nr:hypothetical protein [Pseudonocardiaceae bacterium]
MGLHATRFGNWIVDDAGITFAYARSVAEGYGPVLQPGAAPTEGYSDPTWLALLSIGRLVGLFDRGAIFGVPDYVLFPKALALLCCAGILLTCYGVATKVSQRPALVTFVIGAILAAVPSFVIWCFSGLENSLYALIVTALGATMFRATIDNRLLTTRTALLAGTLAALAALTRPDGLIYAAAYPLVVLVQIRRPTARRGARAVAVAAGAFLVIFGVYLTWRYLEFGRLTSLPTIAKGQAPPDTTTLGRASDLLQYIGALPGIVLAVLIGMTMVRPSVLRGAMISFLVPLVLAVVAYSVLEPDWMGQFRFATPVWPLVAIVGVLCGTAAFRHVGVRGLVVLSAALVVAAIPVWGLFSGYSNSFRAAPTTPLCWVAERPSRADNAYADILGVRQSSLLTADVGGTALTSRLRIVDLDGLTDSKMAGFWADQNWAALDNYVFDVAKPTFIELHPPWGDLTGVNTDPRLVRDYTLIRVDDADNTDWVRTSDVLSTGRLTQARDYATTDVTRTKDNAAAAPLRECGATLRPGQWPN